MKEIKCICRYEKCCMVHKGNLIVLSIGMQYKGKLRENFPHNYALPAILVYENIYNHHRLIAKIGVLNSNLRQGFT